MYRRRKGTCAAGGLSTVELLLLSGSAETVYCAKGRPLEAVCSSISGNGSSGRRSPGFSLLRLLHVYKKFPAPFIARIFARALHKNKHSAVIDLLTGKIKSAAAAYPDRTFGNEADQQLKSLLSKAGKLQEKLTRDGIHAEILREEPLQQPETAWIFRFFSWFGKRAGGIARWKSGNCE